MSQKLLFKRDKILRHPESYAGRRVCHALHRDCNVTRVTWPQFIGHVISTDLAMMDSHWYPVTLQCGLCSEELHYDLVIRMEQLQEQWVMVSSMSGVNLPPLPHMNQGETRASQGVKKIQSLNHLEMSFSANAERYIGQLSQNDLQSLYRKYYLDFKLFGYTLTNWKK